MKWVVMAVALAGLVLAVPVQAADGAVTGRATLPVHIEGLHEASGDDAAFLLEGNDGKASLLVQGADGVAKRVIHRAWSYVQYLPEPQIYWDDTVQVVPLALEDAIISLDERRDGFKAYIWDGDVSMASGADQAPLLVGALGHDKLVDYQLDEKLSFYLNPPDRRDEFSEVIGAGSFESRSHSGFASAAGAFQLFITEATLTYSAADGLQPILAHYREEKVKGDVYNPADGKWVGNGDHTERVQEYLWVEAVDGQADLQFVGVPSSLFSSAATVAVEGVARLPGMDGVVAVVEDGKTTRHEVRGADLELSGRFTLTLHDLLTSAARGSPTRMQVDGEGDFTQVTFAKETHSYDWTSTAAAAGIGALVLAILAWIAIHTKTVLGSVGGLVAGYARVSGQEVLEHPGRQEVYERVKAFPGVSFVQLAQQVSFGASTLTYHLRVLEKNQYIASVRDGRYIRFFDRTAGTYSGDRKNAVSALRNTTSAAMARHIRDHPGVAQCELAQQFEVTASTVTWHINRLTSAGLVQRQRDAHYTRYYVAEGWSRLPLDEQARMSEPVHAVPMVVA